MTRFIHHLKRSLKTPVVPLLPPFSFYFPSSSTAPSNERVPRFAKLFYLDRQRLCFHNLLLNTIPLCSCNRLLRSYEATISLTTLFSRSDWPRRGQHQTTAPLLYNLAHRFTSAPILHTIPHLYCHVTQTWNKQAPKNSKREKFGLFTVILPRPGLAWLVRSFNFARWTRRIRRLGVLGKISKGF